jgi:signal transduction histidine kinase
MNWASLGISPLATSIREKLQGHSTRQQPTSEWLLRQEERFQERTRIARELHDTLLQGLLSATLQLCLVDDGLPVDSPAKPALRRILDLMQRGISEGRAVLEGLRLPDAGITNLERTLSDFVRELSPEDGARVRIVMTGRAKELPSETQRQVSLIMQEALLNALRHSQATHIEVEIEYRRKTLRVVVRDNGIGAEPQLLQSGRQLHWGMAGIRERAKSISAQLRVWSKLGAGTEVEVSLPL